MELSFRRTTFDASLDWNTLLNYSQIPMSGSLAAHSGSWPIRKAQPLILRGCGNRASRCCRRIHIWHRYTTDEIEDEALLKAIRDRRPRHIIVTLGGGTQERLGLYLKRNLEPVPSIHCIGAAIAFLSGDQVHIPMWADRFYLGWLFRCISEPMRYVPRYWSARKLIGLMLRYRDRLPVA